MYHQETREDYCGVFVVLGLNTFNTHASFIVLYSAVVLTGEHLLRLVLNNFSDEITHERLVQLIQACDSLVRVSLQPANCVLNADILTVISAHCPHIERITLKYLHAQDAATMDQLLLDFINLRGAKLTRFDISNCQQATDKSVVKAVESCPKLEYLGLVGESLCCMLVLLF